MPQGLFARLPRILFRPKAIALMLSAALYLAALIIFVPPTDHLLAAVFTLGLAVPLLLAIVNSLALIRWTERLQQTIDSCTSELRPLADSLNKFDAYSHAADLNVGRIAALQHSLEGRVGDLEGHRLGELTGRLGELTGRVGDLEGRRLGELEARIGQLAAEGAERKNIEAGLDISIGETREKLDSQIITLERSVRRVVEDLSLRISDLSPEAANSPRNRDVQLLKEGQVLQAFPGEEVGLPLVSIVVTNYNYARFLPHAIRSCLAQSYPNIEIVVVDDLSTDNSVRDAEGALAGHANYRIVRRLLNGGHGRSMYEGFRESSGDFIAFLDADDVLFQDFVATHVYTHLALPWQVAFTSSDQVNIGPSNRVLTSSSGNLRNTFSTVPSGSDNPHWSRDVKLSPLRISTPIDALNEFGARIDRCIYLPAAVLGYHWGATSSLFFKRAAVEQISIEEVLNKVRVSGDFYYTLAHFISGSAVINSKLGGYRIHESNNFSTNSELDGTDASHAMPRDLFTNTLCEFVRCITTRNLEKFSSRLGPNWLYPEFLANLQKYAGLVNKTPGYDTRIAAHAILDNFEHFSKVIGRDFTTHLLHNKLDMGIEELQRHKIL